MQRGQQVGSGGFVTTDDGAQRVFEHCGAVADATLAVDYGG
jgi:hypothetical protein